ncbi:MAG: tRNA (N6-isopentenyl adenosine(37)-C2)-methylthiotransferase MiaB [Alphaproteobacteria bacterium]
MKYFIKTFGCQMNVYDSDRMADVLKQHGHTEANLVKDADIVILNTCHIREKADEKVFSHLGRLRKIKIEREKQGLQTFIGVAGCVAKALGETIKKRAKYVDFVLGPLNYHNVGNIIDDILGQEEKEFAIDVSIPTISKFDLLPEIKSNSSTSFLAIQEGCNNFCSYCVVPYTRGREFSRPVKDVLEEAKKLIDTGTLEINLLGQNVNGYHGLGSDEQEKDLAYLMHELAKLDGLKRLRYTTSYPSEMSDNIIACHKELDILMPYMHLPAQSGSDNILKAMRRRYSISQYLSVFEKLKKANPNIGMSSDFIVGFPGETDQDFKNTLELVKEVQYIQAYSFKYSPRPQTKAALMDNQIPEELKSERLTILQDLLFYYQKKFNESCVNKSMSVLFEEISSNGDVLFGRTPYMQSVHTTLDNSCLNKILDVNITHATLNSLKGKINEV